MTTVKTKELQLATSMKPAANMCDCSPLIATARPPPLNKVVMKNMFFALNVHHHRNHKAVRIHYNKANMFKEKMEIGN